MSKEQPKIIAFDIFILLFAVLTQVLFLLSYDRGVLVMQYYTAPLVLVFWGMSLHAGAYNKRTAYQLGVAFIGWFVFSRILNGERYLQNSWWHMSALCVTYLLGFPFAFLTGDAQRRRGIAVVASIFSAFFAFLAWGSLIALLHAKDIILPYFGTQMGVQDSRLYTASMHPNGSAILFLIGLMMTLYLVFQYHKRWMIVPAIIMILGFYLGIALTVSRTVMIELSVLVGSLAALYCLRKSFRHGWIRSVTAAVAFIAAVGITYISFDFAVEGVASFQQGEWLSSADAQVISEVTQTPDPEMSIASRPLMEDITTLTGRTQIWKAVIPLIKARPKTVLFGLLNSELHSELGKYTTLPTGGDAHNAWLQTFLNVGLPGLLLSIWFTLLALRCAWRVLLSAADKTSWSEKVLALLLLLLLVNGLCEYVLFVEMFSCVNMIFFLTLGYMLELEKKLVPASKVKKLKV